MIILGSDHEGYTKKQKVKSFLLKKGYKVIDVGSLKDQHVDYPDIAQMVCKLTLKQKTKGILICGTGIGMSIAANKIKGIRGSLCVDLNSAKRCRQDEDANVLCLRGKGSNEKEIIKIVDTWLKTPFSKLARHKRRITKLSKLK